MLLREKIFDVRTIEFVAFLGMAAVFIITAATTLADDAYSANTATNFGIYAAMVAKTLAQSSTSTDRRRLQP